MAIARAIADSGEPALSWSQAQRVISSAKPQAMNLPVLEWLVRANLLIEDVPGIAGSLDEESVVRPGFERLGDFLVAAELLEECKQTDLHLACQPGGMFHAFLKDSNAVEQNSGILAALSILVPERDSGSELPDLVDTESIRSSLVRIAVQQFPSRDPDTFTPVSGSLVREALGFTGFSGDAMDAVLAVSWQPSDIDAVWLDGLLKEKPLASRDAFWCGYLHDRFESHGTVHHLINAAFELPLDQLEQEIAERWVTVLLWFTAAADRRVKDRATRAATAVLTARPEVISNVLLRLVDSDDDEVRERTLLSCYGALIASRNLDLVRLVSGMLQEAYRSDPKAFDNALIRDHIRCIAELALKLNALPEVCDPELTMQPISSEWPLALPSDEKVKHWDHLPMLAVSCLHDDFFRYSMGCLHSWEHGVPRGDMGKWILQTAARVFGYEGSGCENYDRYMLGKHGGGRGKPTWAERIGKKYQWIAMYQLASRLHDHVDRERDSWEPQPLANPLILLDERKLDPTLPPNVAAGERHGVAWWITASADLGSDETVSDEEWVARQEDVPAIERLLSVVKRDGQNWRLLVSYPSWGQPEEGANRNNPYRQVWMHLESYLIQKQHFAAAFEGLHRRNLFGNWMPEGSTWLYGFAGEYPWATPFNTEPEEWHGRGGRGGDLPFDYEPSWNRLAVEWEYDASISESLHMIVPARTFFSPGDLWWNGKDGYYLVNRRTVFRDPSVTEAGARSLIVDADELLGRLNRLGLRLIWTLLGEKWILGGPHDNHTPRRTFSGVAYLGEDGLVHVGDRVFFEDYDQDAGPMPVKE
ncbi:MAG: hypothetical protein Q8R28_22520 [Dehalococcoidia bacterium]|nr:hypothetical protein [Dehalococcoidia bacterium]